MKKIKLLLLIQFGFYFYAFGQTDANPPHAATTTPAPVPTPATIPTPTPPPPTAPTQKCSIVLGTYSGNTYIFNGNISLVTCDAVGGAQGSPIIVYKGLLFNVVGKTADCQLIIKFVTFKPHALSQRLTYNIKQSPPQQQQQQSPTQQQQQQQQQQFQSDNELTATDKTSAKQEITPQNTQYFLISLEDFAALCTSYTYQSNWSLSLGTLIQPFKFRPTKSLFTSNISLGAACYLNYKFTANSSIGIVGGISATSVTLDSFSTKGLVTTNTDRPAVTPSLSVVYAFKNINFLFGSGIDYVNKTSNIEKSWIFNGKPWFGFGIGVNIFSPNQVTNSAVKDPKQE